MNEHTKKCIAFILAAAIGVAVFWASGKVARAETFTGSAECMIVLERDSGRVLNEKNADKRRPMASTTKIATAITVIDRVSDLDKKIKVPAEAVGVEGSSIYLQRDEELTVRDLLYGLMLQSGNDCAVALAITTAGSVKDFAAMMNETAAKAGAENTNFTNPHGLHDDNHYTTARDLAKIAAYAMKNETFRKIVSTKRYTAPWEGRDYDRVIVNKNKILSTYEGGDGVKTGFTKKAGRCLVSSATRDGMCVIAVVLNCGPMFEDCRRLMDCAFADYSLKDVIAGANVAEQAAVKDGKASTVKLGSGEKVLYPLTEKEFSELNYKTEGVVGLRAPVNFGTENGKLYIYTGNRLLFETKLFTIEEVEPLSVSDRLGDIVKNWNG